MRNVGIAIKLAVSLILAYVGSSSSQLMQLQGAAANTAIEQRNRIDDGVERKAFEHAAQEPNISTRAERLESFLTTHPSNQAQEASLALLLDCYQRIGNMQKLNETADRLLQIDANNLDALFAKAKVFSLLGDSKKEDMLKSLQLAKRGLTVLRESADNDVAKEVDSTSRRRAMTALLNEVAGTISVRMKDFSSAQRYLLDSVTADSNNFGTAYQLSLAYLLSSPPNVLHGLFFAARAENLAPIGTREKLEDYGRKQCLKYYDSDRGWQALKEIARAHPMPPADMDIQW